MENYILEALLSWRCCSQPDGKTCSPCTCVVVLVFVSRVSVCSRPFITGVFLEHTAGKQLKQEKRREEKLQLRRRALDIFLSAPRSGCDNRIFPQLRMKRPKTFSQARVAGGGGGHSGDCGCGCGGGGGCDFPRFLRCYDTTSAPLEKSLLPRPVPRELSMVDTIARI